MLLVCKNHIKQGIQYLNTPHIISIKDKNFEGCCVFCDEIANYKLFYSVPVSKSHRITIKEMIQRNNLYIHKKNMSSTTSSTKNMNC